MLKNLIFLLIFTINILPQIKIYVSTTGNDSWSGRYPTNIGTTANNGTNNGPYLTLNKAVQEFTRLDSTDYYKTGVRDSIKNGIEIVIRGGKYHITNTLWIRNTNQGISLPRPTLKVLPYNNESVILSGGTEITNFTIVTNPTILNRFDDSVKSNILVADLNNSVISVGTVIDISTRFDLIYKDEQMNLSRYPKNGFIDIGNVSTSIIPPDTIHKLIVGNIPRLLTWKKDEPIYAGGYWNRQYYFTYQPIYTIDTLNNRLDSMKIVVSGNPLQYGYLSGGLVYKENIPYYYYPPFYLTNILEEVNLPRDYYLDRVNKLLYFYPPTTLTEYPEVTTLNTMFYLNTCNGVFISNIIIENCNIGIFMNGGGTNFGRYDGVNISNCTIRNIKSYAIYMDGTYNTTISNNEIYNLNSMGMMLNWCGIRHYVDNLTKSNIKIIGNKIHDFAKYFINDHSKGLAMSGIRIEKSVGVLVSDNEVYNSKTIGIFATGNDNIIENNNFYNLTYESLSLGAIYTWGDLTSQGNIIRNNYIHDIVNSSKNKYPLESYRSIGVHIDGFSSGWTIKSNIFNNCGTGVLIEAGSDNNIRNNILYKCDYAIRTYEARTWQYPDNIASIYSDAARVHYTSTYWTNRYPRLVELLADTSFKMKYNIFQNNIVSKCTVSRHNVTEAIGTLQTLTQLLGEDINHTSNTQVPFNETTLTFKINAYSSQINAIKFIPIPFNYKWKK